MRLSDELRPLLMGVVETLIPVDPSPGAVHERVVEEMERQLDEAKKDQLEPLTKWLEAMAVEAMSVFSFDFLSLHRSSRDELFDRLEMDNVRTDWGMEDPKGYFNSLVDWVADIHLGPEIQSAES